MDTLTNIIYFSYHDGAFGRQGGRYTVIMGAAVTLKDHLTFSILTVFLFSLLSLLFALCLSWEDKSNVSYFLFASFMLAVLGSVLCTKKSISIAEVSSLLNSVRGK
ncbi:hypothetical protein SAMN05216175_10779 [Neptunomonas qingdaonensis]|uniref:Uncharacterized protein n=1 Tax=Neptunomonas qingdaonensis TaxID=1045558 RepID=A0A1I2S269_9GAMM|nr:hypothetical protein SAMN05216175_10779 [Neptunomonas qingdaonensis]